MGNVESRRHAAEEARRARINNEKVVKTAQSITWNDFAAFIRELNEKCQRLKLDRNEYYCFGVKRGTTDDAIRWKETVQVVCLAVDAESKQYRFFKLYTLHSFLNVYYAFTCTSLLDEKKKITSEGNSTAGNDEGDPSTSACTAEVMKKVLSEEDLCCVCFDRRADTTLPCTHSFCAVCVVQWSEYRTRFLCPLCKSPVSQPIEDSWEMAEGPEDQEVLDYFAQLTEGGVMLNETNQPRAEQSNP